LSKDPPFFSEGIAYGDGRIESDFIEPLRLLPSGRGRVLDLGCGRGGSRRALEAKGYAWVGMDLRRDGGVKVVADAHRLPFADGSFDAVYSLQVLEHLSRPWDAAEEVFRVLKPGGVFCGGVAALEPFHHSYFNYTHWGLESVLRRAGMVPRTIEPGASAFLVILHHLVDGGGPRFSVAIARLTVRPLLWMLRLAGTGFIVLRHGKNSQERRQIEAFFRKLPLRFAGHLNFLAEKPADSGRDPGAGSLSTVQSAATRHRSPAR
jgi:SAM-dependent methyltransferase